MSQRPAVQAVVVQLLSFGSLLGIPALASFCCVDLNHRTVCGACVWVMNVGMRRRRDERPTGPTIHGSMTGGGSDTESSATDSDSGLSSDGPGAVSMNEESFSSDSSGGSLDIDDDEGASDLDSTGSGSDDFGGSESDLDDF